MAAYAEGMAILSKANVGAAEQEHDAETTPLRDPWAYRYDIDTAEVAEVWRRGSVISSWLLDLTAIALHRGPGARGLLRPRVRLGRGALDGRWPRWTRASPRTSSPPPCSSASARGARPTSPTGCCRPCASSSAATRRRRPTAGERPSAAASGRGPREQPLQSSAISASSRSSKRSRNRSRTAARWVRRARGDPPALGRERGNRAAAVVGAGLAPHQARALQAVGQAGEPARRVVGRARQPRSCAGRSPREPARVRSTVYRAQRDALRPPRSAAVQLAVVTAPCIADQPAPGRDVVGRLGAGGHVDGLLVVIRGRAWDRICFAQQMQCPPARRQQCVRLSPVPRPLQRVTRGTARP